MSKLFKLIETVNRDSISNVQDFVVTFKDKKLQELILEYTNAITFLSNECIPHLNEMFMAPNNDKIFAIGFNLFNSINPNAGDIALELYQKLNPKNNEKLTQIKSKLTNFKFSNRVLNQWMKQAKKDKTMQFIFNDKIVVLSPFYLKHNKAQNDSTFNKVVLNEIIPTEVYITAMENKQNLQNIICQHLNTNKQNAYRPLFIGQIVEISDNKEYMAKKHQTQKKQIKNCQNSKAIIDMMALVNNQMTKEIGVVISDGWKTYAYNKVTELLNPENDTLNKPEFITNSHGILFCLYFNPPKYDKKCDKEFPSLKPHLSLKRKNISNKVMRQFLWVFVIDPNGDLSFGSENESKMKTKILNLTKSMIGNKYMPLIDRSHVIYYTGPNFNCRFTIDPIGISDTEFIDNDSAYEESEEESEEEKEININNRTLHLPVVDYQRLKKYSIEGHIIADFQNLFNKTNNYIIKMNNKDITVLNGAQIKKLKNAKKKITKYKSNIDEKIQNKNNSSIKNWYFSPELKKTKTQKPFRINDFRKEPIYNSCNPNTIQFLTNSYGGLHSCFGRITHFDGCLGQSYFALINMYQTINNLTPKLTKMAKQEHKNEKSRDYNNQVPKLIMKTFKDSFGKKFFEIMNESIGNLNNLNFNSDDLYITMSQAKLNIPSNKRLKLHS